MDSLPVEDPEAKPASFHGRLQLQDFMHIPESSPSRSPSSSSTVRRSPRRANTKALQGASPSATSLSGSPVPSPSPRKRTTPSDQARATHPAKRPSTDPSPSKRSRSGAADTSSSAVKRTRPKASYAAPSTYAHLPLLPDAVAPDLLILFVGLNPGIQTATTGHAYAHPSNLFWKLLSSSGLTDRLVPASQDRELPARYGLGLTNIVARPSRNGAELSKAEMDEGVAVLEDKARTWRPEVICLVGKGIWESVFRVRKGRAIRKDEFQYGWQPEEENMGVLVAGERDGETGPDDVGEMGAAVDGRSWAGARVFVATSTSGLAATLSPAEKERIWGELGAWCTRRRAERQAEAENESLVS